jgi:hypothetical protein
MGQLSARGLQLRWASGPKTNGPSSPATGRVGVSACAQAHGHRGRSRRSGAGGTGSPLGEVRLDVRDEHHRGREHSLGNTRERAAHRDGGVA